jgi:hypothetical protein
MRIIDHGPAGLDAILGGGFDLLFIEQEYIDRTERMEVLDLLKNYLLFRKPIVLVTAHNPHGPQWTAERCAAYDVRAVLSYTRLGMDAVHTAIKILGIDPRPQQPRVVIPMTHVYGRPDLPLTRAG